MEDTCLVMSSDQRKMRILVISMAVWRDDQNGGNVLSNLFRGFDADFAQIYCSPGVPYNSICQNYYMMTDKMMIRNVFRHSPAGKSIEMTAADAEFSAQKNNDDRKFYTFFRRHPLPVFYLIKDQIWHLAHWKSTELEDFIRGFDPDVIYAPCFANAFMLDLDLYAQQLTGRPMISYVSDDNYSLRQFSLSLFFWIHRFWIRSRIRAMFSHCSAVYTMTEIQKFFFEEKLHTNMKILRKSGLSLYHDDRSIHEQVRLIYAGGIYLNRWKTLCRIAECVKELNETGTSCRLDIYTANRDIPEKGIRILNDGKNSFLHDSIPFAHLQEQYAQSDIALHVESFDLKYRLQVRMSFSTKIVDCLGSGCAVAAIADEKQGGMQYLMKEKAAFCITKPDQIKEQLPQLIKDKELIHQYQEAAYRCMLQNHDPEKNRKILEGDFHQIAGM